jgi:hypothetical protein
VAESIEPPDPPSAPEDLYMEEVTLLQATLPATPSSCPGCGKPLAPRTVVCVACGYNIKLGRRMETQVAVDQSPSGGREGDPFADAAEKAEYGGWVLTHAGLTITLYSLTISAVCAVFVGSFFLLEVLAWLVPSSLKSVERIAAVFPALALLCGFAAGGSFFSLITGWFVCCGVPERTRTRPFIHGAAGCAVFLIALVALTLLLRAFAGSDGSDDILSTAPWNRIHSGLGNAVAWGEGLALIGGNVLFCVFLGALGDYLGERRARPFSLAVLSVVGSLIIVSACIKASSHPSKAQLELFVQLVTLASVIHYVSMALLNVCVLGAIKR